MRTEMPISSNTCKYCFNGIDHPTKNNCSSNFGIHPDFPGPLDYIRKRVRDRDPVHIRRKYNFTRRQYRRIINRAKYNPYFDGPKDYYDSLSTYILSGRVKI